MAKVQGKKVVAKSSVRRATARPKAAVAKTAKKPVAPKVRAAKAANKAKPAVKAKVVAKPVAKANGKPALKVAPKPAPKPVKVVAAPKPVEKPAPKPAPRPLVVVPQRPAAAADDKKRARRSRPRISSSGGPVANWLHTGEKPRPSSFMPAPQRAEAPSLIAAPPASSDRLIRNEDLIAPAVRTVPVRVDVEAMGGRVSIYPNPIEVSLRPGEGIEWDFRYLGG